MCHYDHAVHLHVYTVMVHNGTNNIKILFVMSKNAKHQLQVGVLTEGAPQHKYLISAT